MYLQLMKDNYIGKINRGILDQKIYQCNSQIESEHHNQTVKRKQFGQDVGSYVCITIHIQLQVLIYIIKYIKIQYMFRKRFVTVSAHLLFIVANQNLISELVNNIYISTQHKFNRYIRQRTCMKKQHCAQTEWNRDPIDNGVD